MKYTLRKVKRILTNPLRLAKRYARLSRKHVLEFPSTIQLPITHLCNFDCVMCGMHHMAGRKDFTASELRTILQDKLFREVSGIGVNGGEPFLKNDLTECITAMAQTLPKLLAFSFISN